MAHDVGAATPWGALRKSERAFVYLLTSVHYFNVLLLFKKNIRQYCDLLYLLFPLLTEQSIYLLNDKIDIWHPRDS